MKRAFLLTFLATTVLIGQDPGWDIQAPGLEMMRGEGELRSLGVLVRFKVMVSSTNNVPVKLWSSTAGRLDTRGGVVRRVLFDPLDGVWFAYDIAVARDSANGFLLTFGPSSANAPKDPGGNAVKVMPLQKYPPPQRIRDGDVVAIDGMVSSDRAQKLTDYIQIISPRRDR